MGVGMLTYSVFGIASGLTNSNFMEPGAVLAFIYTIYAIAQFFSSKKVSTYFKALVSYILGMITFTIVAFGIGFLIDWINKL